MKLCRFDDDKLGLVRGEEVLDVTAALDAIPAVRWPLPQGDPLIAHLDAVRARIEAVAVGAEARPLAEIALKSPVANPSKIIGAPVNYQKHLDEAQADREINVGKEIKTIDYYGLFLKANSSLVGPSEGVTPRFPDRRNDHECELAAIIGRAGTRIPREQAFAHIAAYAIGLDMTVRGSEDRSFRKSCDSYSVLGPWLVTADEIEDPDALDFTFWVNGEVRQQSNTRHLIFDVGGLIEYASSFYTLLPGDVIMTGTPEGVGPVAPGDVMVAEMEGIGRMEIPVRAA
ncbi:MAG: fumarylacetoacetate hydrolase family protein [Alphaproteobacteria bacterium]|nr:fumarylacetoacetate hydrolase family protein [Alphaproteobacteria bacterium]